MGTSGYRWPLVESKYYIVTKLRLLQTHRFPIHGKFQAKNANWEGLLYKDSVKDLLKIPYPRSNKPRVKMFFGTSNEG